MVKGQVITMDPAGQIDADDREETGNLPAAHSVFLKEAERLKDGLTTMRARLQKAVDGVLAEAEGMVEDVELARTTVKADRSSLWRSLTRRLGLRRAA